MKQKKMLALTLSQLKQLYRNEELRMKNEELPCGMLA